MLVRMLFPGRGAEEGLSKDGGKVAEKNTKRRDESGLAVNNASQALSWVIYARSRGTANSETVDTTTGSYITTLGRTIASIDRFWYILPSTPDNSTRANVEEYTQKSAVYR